MKILVIEPEKAPEKEIGDDIHGICAGNSRRVYRTYIF